MKKNTHCEWKYISLDTLKLENGKSWEMVSRKWNAQTVAGLVYHSERKSYILISQFRYPVNTRVIEMPAGIQDKWVSPEEHLRQEILEEIWYSDIQSMRYIWEFPSSWWLTNETSLLYYVEISWEAGNQHLWKSENIDILEIHENDIHSFISRQSQWWVFIDPKVGMALYSLQI
jgi:hypothetical protein